MVKIDEMICIDSSGDWGWASAFRIILGGDRVTHLWSGCNVDLRMSPCTLRHESVLPGP